MLAARFIGYNMLWKHGDSVHQMPSKWDYDSAIRVRNLLCEAPGTDRRLVRAVPANGSCPLFSGIPHNDLERARQSHAITIRKCSCDKMMRTM